MQLINVTQFSQFFQDLYYKQVYGEQSKFFDEFDACLVDDFEFMIMDRPSLDNERTFDEWLKAFNEYVIHHQIVNSNDLESALDSWLEEEAQGEQDESQAI